MTRCIDDDVRTRRPRGRAAAAVVVLVTAFALLFAGAGTAMALTPPARPTLTSVVAAGPTALTVRWQDTSNNEAGFWLYVNNAFSGPSRAANTTSTQLTGLSPSTRYCIKVESYSWDGQNAAGSGQSGEMCATTASNDGGERPSPAPSNQSVTPIPGGLRLTWYDRSLNETAWLVHDGSSNPQRSFTVNGGTTGWRSFDWTGMSAGQYACLHVRGYNQWGAGDWPDNPYWACGTAPSGLLAPTNVTVTPHFTRALNVTFFDNATTETDFEIYNDRGETRRPNQRTYPTGQRSFLWDGLTANTHMCFRVRAINASGASPWSSWACGTTKPY